MDPLAHTLSGIVLAHAGPRRRIGDGCLLALVLASNMVDIDIFGLLFFEQPSWLYRRMWTHSALTTPVLVLLGAAVFSRLFRNASFASWLFVFLLGAALHLFMDLINSYGVVLFFPLSMKRFELAWVFIVDLYIWGILLAALCAPLVARLFSRRLSLEHAARAGITALMCYIAVCAGLRTYSLKLLGAQAKRMPAQCTFRYVFPEPFGPWRFHGVLKHGSTYRSYLIHPLAKTVVEKRTFQTDEKDPAVARLIDSETGRKYQWFFKAPIWEKQSRDFALVSDIRFRSLLLNRTAPFRYKVPLKTVE